MNALPEHRRILSGRTWSQSYSRSHYAPISGPWHRHEQSLGRLLAVLIGIVGGIALVSWWAS